MNKGFAYFDNFLDSQKIFQKNPDMKIVALDIWVNECCKYLFNIYNKISFGELDPIVREEFGKVEDKESLVALTSFLFSRMNIFNVSLIKQNQIIQQLQSRIAEFQR